MSSDERLREEPGPGAPKALALAFAVGPLGPSADAVWAGRISR
jgi:hypothetical protein